MRAAGSGGGGSGSGGGGSGSSEGGNTKEESGLFEARKESTGGNARIVGSRNTRREET